MLAAATVAYTYASCEAGLLTLFASSLTNARRSLSSIQVSAGNSLAPDCFYLPWYCDAAFKPKVTSLSWLILLANVLMKFSKKGIRCFALPE